MKPFNFVKSLKTAVKKHDTLEELELTEKLIDTALLPTYKSMDEMFTDRKFQSKEVQAMEKQFFRKVRTKYRGNMVSVIHQVIVNHRDTMNRVEKLLTKAMDRSEPRSSMTYFKANLIQSIQMSRFFVNYAQKLAVFLLAYETQSLSSDKGPVDGNFRKIEIDWMEKNYGYFLHLCHEFADDSKKLIEKFENVPEVLVNPDEEEIADLTVKGRNLDVLKTRFISARWNPFYHLGIMLADYRHAQYEAAMSRKDECDFQIQFLRAKLADPDSNHPQIEQQISNLREMSVKYERQIAEYEKEAV